ncbi:PspA-associated protein PspAA [Brevibacterium litoralis]|uniref:PspA-associated protein PspAA n=1 Tax=Brevibacterium litoralis TaxID=3138935 RepID=UPI0032EE8281
MIVRIMGEGQFDVADVEQDTLQKYDDEVETAVEGGDSEHVHSALVALREFVLTHAKPVPDDYLGASDIVVPYPDAEIAEITELLTGEGFIPELG